MEAVDEERDEESKRQILEISVAIMGYPTYISQSFCLEAEAISGHAGEYSNKASDADYWRTSSLPLPKMPRLPSKTMESGVDFRKPSKYS